MSSRGKLDDKSSSRFTGRLGDPSRYQIWRIGSQTVHSSAPERQSSPSPTWPSGRTTSTTRSNCAFSAASGFHNFLVAGAAIQRGSSADGSLAGGACGRPSRARCTGCSTTSFCRFCASQLALLRAAAERDVVSALPAEQEQRAKHSKTLSPNGFALLVVLLVEGHVHCPPSTRNSGEISRDSPEAAYLALATCLTQGPPSLLLTGRP